MSPLGSAKAPAQVALDVVDRAGVPVAFLYPAAFTGHRKTAEVLSGEARINSAAFWFARGFGDVFGDSFFGFAIGVFGNGFLKFTNAFTSELRFDPFECFFAFKLFCGELFFVSLLPRGLFLLFLFFLMALSDCVVVVHLGDHSCGYPDTDQRGDQHQRGDLPSLRPRPDPLLGALATTTDE